MCMTKQINVTLFAMFWAGHRLATIHFDKPTLRPPVYSEMLGDMGNIINKVAASYTDQSCTQLNYEELVADCWYKTTQMNADGLMLRCQTRSEYFAQYKTAISNHVCSLVQKYRFTEKRTGIKPLPKKERFKPENMQLQRSSKPVEISLNDPENDCQVAEIESGDDSSEYRELLEEVMSRLGETPRMVLRQIIEPNQEALILAGLESEIGRRTGETVRLKLKQEHLAAGIAMDADYFAKVHELIKKKCLFMKSQKFQPKDDPRATAAMATLVQFFGLQLPRTLDEIIKKRCIAIAARHQASKILNGKGEVIDKPIVEAMRYLNIPVPELRGDKFRCHGIMFQRHHRICMSCGLKESCEAEAANLELGEITISNKLLGTARNARVPTIAPSAFRNQLPSAIIDSRAEEIVNFLNETFKKVVHIGEICYRHRDRLEGDGKQFILSLGKQAYPFKLRFINPSEELQSSLTHESYQGRGGVKSYYLPDSLKAADAINLINLHAEATFSQT